MQAAFVSNRPQALAAVSSVSLGCLISHGHAAAALYAPAVRSSREHPPDERQLSASPRASPFPSQEILQCRIVNMASARSRFSFVFASLLPSRAFLCIARGHGPAPSRKSGLAKWSNFTHQPRRSACKAKTGWASTLRRRRTSAASQLSVGTRIWA